MRKNQKRFISLACMLTLALSGCGKTADTATLSTTEDNSVATTEALVSANELPDSQSSEEALRTEYPLTLEVYGPDGTVYEQTYEAAPTSVITNIPSATNMLLELGLQDSISGILEPDNAPEEKWAAAYKELTVLADKKNISKEVVIGSEPDLVFGRAMTFTDESMGSIETLNEMGIPVYVLKASNFEIEQSLTNVIEDVRNIGMIFDVQDAANAYAAELESRLAEVNSKVAALESDTPLRVMYMTAYADGTFNTFGANSALQECMLNELNAENVLEKGESSLTYENLMALNPDVIIYVTSDRNAQTDSTAVETLLADETIAGVNAIKNGKVIEIPYDALMDYGPRIFDTMEELYDFFYAE